MAMLTHTEECMMLLGNLLFVQNPFWASWDKKLSRDGFALLDKRAFSMGSQDMCFCQAECSKAIERVCLDAAHASWLYLMISMLLVAP